MRNRSVARLAVAVLALALVGVAAVRLGPASTAGAVPGAWVRPVPGRVARAFAPPATRYGPGHLGVDLVAAAGTPVRSAGAGTVVFAGTVAGSRHVVVLHPGGLRTSYSFLATVRVRRGEPIEAGTVVGLAGGAGRNHDGAVLHLGLRIGATYADPMRLFSDPDLAGRVHLAPAVDPAANPRGRGLPAGAATGAAMGPAAEAGAVASALARDVRATPARLLPVRSPNAGGAPSAVLVSTRPPPGAPNVPGTARAGPEGRSLQ